MSQSPLMRDPISRISYPKSESGHHAEASGASGRIEICAASVEGHSMEGLSIQAVHSCRFPGSGTSPDPYVVEYEENDTGNPLNWPNARKYWITILATLHTVAVGFASSGYSGGFDQMRKYFEVSPILITAGISAFLVGAGFGPMLWGPFSETWGRRRIFITTYGAFVLCNVACSFSTNIQLLLSFRFLAGFTGSSAWTNGPGLVAEMFVAKERGLALACFALLPFLGPVLGPIIGGFVGQACGWRWCFGVMALFSGVMFILSALCIPETHTPYILRRRARELSKFREQAYIYAADKNAAPASFVRKLWLSVTRAFLMLVTEAICVLMSIYVACIYGILYALFEAFPVVYQVQRHWSPSLSGCAFGGIGLGIILACIYNIYEYTRYRKKVNRLGLLPPEERLNVGKLGGCCLPISLFAFAAFTLRLFPSFASIVVSIPFGLGFFLLLVGIQNYLVDVYGAYAASALAAHSLLRSLFGAAFPLFTLHMYNTLGVQWGTALFGALSLIFVPIPFLFQKYGDQIRQHSRYSACPIPTNQTDPPQLPDDLGSTNQEIAGDNPVGPIDRANSSNHGDDGSVDSDSGSVLEEILSDGN